MNETSAVATPVPREGACASAAAPGRRRHYLGAFCAVAAFEFRVAARSRWILISAGGFGAVTTALSYFGLAAAGYAGFQGFERTAISLLSLSIYFVPLFGLVLGLAGFAARDGSDLVFVLPADRGVVVLGKLAGLSASVAAATLVGLGAAGLAIASQTGPEGIGGYLCLVIACVVMAGVFVSLGALAGLLVRDHLQASGLAVASWIWLVFLYELVVLGVLFAVPEASVRPLLLASLFGSPVSLVRVLTLVAIGAEPALGPAGALLLRWFGSAGSVAILGAGLSAWLVVPSLAAAWVARRSE